LLYCWLNPDSLGSMTGPRTEALMRAEALGWLGTVVFNPLCRLPEFVAGVAVGCAFKMGYRLPWIALLLPACLLFVVGRLPYPVVHNAWLLPVWCVLVLALASPLAAGRWFWTAPWMILLGEASYGIYILQYPVSTWFKAIVLKTTGREIQGDYPSLAWLATYCVLLLGASIASFYLIENPSRAWIRERFGKGRASRKQEAPVR
jgi:peptidoglycan/LPS O-acetylase OafA/YrhL